MKIKILATLCFAVFAQASFSQSLLFSHRTGIDYQEVSANGQRCIPYIIGASHIGVSIFSNELQNDSRFLVFDLKGDLRLTLLGREVGFDQCWAVPSPTSSFQLLGTTLINSELDIYKLYIYNRRTKSWTASTTVGNGVVYADATAGNALASGIWAELKNVGGKLVLYVYRY